MEQIQCFIFLLLSLIILLPTVLVASTSLYMSPPPCPEKCGNITIPYPFGIGTGCYRDGFDISCNKTTTPPKAFLGSESESNIELIDINITSGEARVYIGIEYVCYDEKNSTYDSNQAWIDLGFRPAYLFPNKRNKFTTIGCEAMAYMVALGTGNVGGLYDSGCASFCLGLNSTTGDGGACNGLGCCQTAIPPQLFHFEVHWNDYYNYFYDFNPCTYAVLVEEDWYKFHVDDLSGLDFYERNKKGAPLVLDWAIRANGTCHDGVEKSTVPACLSSHSSCINTSNGEGYLCQCFPGYEGNPYIHDGCLGNYINFEIISQEAF